MGCGVAASESRSRISSTCQPGCILHWDFSHFVVLERVGGRGVQIVDPAYGRRSVTTSELRHSFTGAVLLPRARRDVRADGGSRKSSWRYLQEVLSGSGLWVRISVISVLLQCFALALPILTGALVDRVVPRNDYSLLMVLGGALAAFIVFHFLGSLIRAHLLLHVRTLVDARMTLGFIEHLAALPYSFFQQRSAGDLMMRLNSNASVREIITAGVLSALLDGGFVTLYLLILFAISPPIALVALGLGALQVAIVLLTWRRQRELMSASLQTQAAAQDYQFEMLTGMETLKAMGVEQAAVDRWSDLFVDVLNVVDRSRSAGRHDRGGDERATARIAVADPRLRWPEGLERRSHTGHHAGGQCGGGRIPQPAGHARRRRRASFNCWEVTSNGSTMFLTRRRSRPDRKHGQRTGFAGRSDWSTSVSATERWVRSRSGMCRWTFSPASTSPSWVDPAPGNRRWPACSSVSTRRNRVGCCTTGSISPNWICAALRRQFGVMMQQPYLFGGSVRSNIALGNPSMTMEAVIEAAKLAHIHDDIVRMPLGYDTLLASGGASLSGGQRQRLALARVLARRPSILVLDEATNALDAVTEAQVHHELRALAMHDDCYRSSPEHCGRRRSHPGAWRMANWLNRAPIASYSPGTASTRTLCTARSTDLMGRSATLNAIGSWGLGCTQQVENEMATESDWKVAALAIGLTILTTACGGSEAPVLTFSGSVVGREGDVIRRQLEGFRRTHPTIAVALRATPDAADQRHQLYVQWLNARASDPDVLQLDVVWTPEFAAAGWIARLGRFRPAIEHFFPTAVAANRWGGGLYALPWFIDVGMLYWRTDLVPGPPRDLNELVQFAARARDDRGVPFGFVWQGARYEGLVTVFLEHLGAFGGAILDDVGRVVVDSAPAERALAYMRDTIYTDGVVPPAVLTWQEEQTRFAFQGGQAAFMRNWPYAYTLLQDSTQSNVAGRVRVTAMPAGPGGHSTAALGGSALAINAWSDQPAAAYELIDFLLQPEQMIERARLAGQFPARPALYETRALVDALTIPPADALKVIEQAVARPSTPVYSELSEILQIALHRALTRQQEPRQALHGAATAMRALLAKVKLGSPVQ